MGVVFDDDGEVALGVGDGAAGLRVVCGDGGAHGVGVRAGHPRLGADQGRAGAGGEDDGAALGQGGEVGDVEDAFAVQLLGDGAVPAAVGDVEV